MEAGHENLRLGRYSQAGQIYLITTVTWRRRPYFLDRKRTELVSQLSSAEETWRANHCLCWVLMPDHWHGLIQLAQGDDLSKIMRGFKGHAARRLNALAGAGDHVWAKGFHDHALRSEESVLDAARYVIANPVRAGLVRRVEDYPFWDAPFAGGRVLLDDFALPGRD
jgi:REP element-mobilizing transposase RayT